VPGSGPAVTVAEGVRVGVSAPCFADAFFHKKERKGYFWSIYVF